VPRKLALIAPPGARHAGVGLLLDLCTMANAYAAELYEAVEPTAALEVEVLSLDGAPVVAADGRTIPVDGALTSQRLWNGVFIAATDQPPSRNQLTPLCAWLGDQHRRGAWVAASGPGIFLLAEAGLLTGGRCAPPWRLEQAFRRRWRDVLFEAGPAVVEWNRTLTAGSLGAEPALALALIEAICAPNLADVLAKRTRIAELSPAPHAVVPCDDRLVARAQDALQRNFSHEVKLEAMAAELGVSHRTLLRRFRTATGQTPSVYLQTLRVESAKQMLAKTTRPIDRIGYMAGYADSRFFKTVFRRKVGVTPAEFRRQARALRPMDPSQAVAQGS
jgi:transcriptional regulator GlxA family with amidase domain